MSVQSLTGRCQAFRGLDVVRVGGACGPPPPVAAPLASSLRAPSRGDPPLKDRAHGYAERGVVRCDDSVLSQAPDVRACHAGRRALRRGATSSGWRDTSGHNAWPATQRRSTRCDVLKRGVAAGRSAQRAYERSSDWRRGAAGSPDPDKSDPDKRADQNFAVSGAGLEACLGKIGSNSSTGLPDGSSTRICLPPTPVTMSLRKWAPAGAASRRWRRDRRLRSRSGSSRPALGACRRASAASRRPRPAARRAEHEPEVTARQHREHRRRVHVLVEPEMLQ